MLFFSRWLYDHYDLFYFFWSRSNDQDDLWGKTSFSDCLVPIHFFWLLLQLLSFFLVVVWTTTHIIFIKKIVIRIATNKHHYCLSLYYIASSIHTQMNKTNDIQSSVLFNWIQKKSTTNETTSEDSDETTWFTCNLT